MTAPQKGKFKPLNLDKNGIPFLTRHDIEERAEDFIKFFDKKCCERPKFTPLPLICERLKNEHGVKFAFESDLGNSPDGDQYRGRFHIPSTTILIDKSLPLGGERFNFTLAHELAHFVLHRKIDYSVIKKEREEQLSDTHGQLMLDQIQGKNPRDLIEWQANKFASSILLPRLTVPVAVINKQVELGMRRAGTIFHDHQPRNRHDYHQIMEHLVGIFITSKTAIKYRLRELNILVETVPIKNYADRDFVPISNALANIFQKIAE